MQGRRGGWGQAGGCPAIHHAQRLPPRVLRHAPALLRPRHAQGRSQLHQLPKAFHGLLHVRCPPPRRGWGQAPQSTCRGCQCGGHPLPQLGQEEVPGIGVVQGVTRLGRAGGCSSCSGGAGALRTRRLPTAQHGGAPKQRPHGSRCRAQTDLWDQLRILRSQRRCAGQEGGSLVVLGRVEGCGSALHHQLRSDCTCRASLSCSGECGPRTRPGLAGELHLSKAL